MVDAFYSTKTELIDLIERNKESDWPDISSEHKAFAHEYILNGFSHIKAGKKIKIKRPLRVLNNPLVVAYISYVQDINFTSQLITKRFIEAQYLELIPILKGEKSIPAYRGKKKIRIKKFHANELINVLRNLSDQSEKDFGENNSKPVELHVTLASSKEN